LSESLAELRQNERQWAAFESLGHTAVLAPPGSGKTKLLTTRLAIDLAERIRLPHGAACITLTNPAANELRRRLVQLGVVSRSTLFVGTVHSFALRCIILPFASPLGESELASRGIADSLSLDAAFGEAIRAVYGLSGTQTRFVRSTVEYHRRRLSAQAEWLRAGEEIQQVNIEFEAALRRRGLLDFDGMIAAAVSFVEDHPVVRKVLSSRFHGLYIDEYQDLSPGLDRLVRALCLAHSTGVSLFAVGDPDQAVYGWTGTRPELLVELAKRSDVVEVRLEENYRCGEEIIRVANRVHRSSTSMRGERSGGTVSAQKCAGGFAQQCEAAVEVVRQAERSGTPLHEVVVIASTNPRCEEAARALRAEGISTFVRSSDYRQTEATMFLEGAAAWSVLGRESSGHRLSELQRLWRNLLGRSWSREKAVALTALLLESREHKEGSAASFISSIRKIGLDSGLIARSKSEDAIEVSRMSRALEGRSGAIGSTIEEIGERARRQDRVEVTTMTSSKGLEFDVVIILGMDNKHVPDFRSLGDAAKMAEDRRKFYVSLTRARSSVHIFYSGFAEWSTGRRDFAGPSQFLREIDLA